MSAPSSPGPDAPEEWRLNASRSPPLPSPFLKENPRYNSLGELSLPPLLSSNVYLLLPQAFSSPFPCRPFPSPSPLPQDPFPAPRLPPIAYPSPSPSSLVLPTPPLPYLFPLSLTNPLSLPHPSSPPPHPSSPFLSLSLPTLPLPIPPQPYSPPPPIPPSLPLPLPPARGGLTCALSGASGVCCEI